MQTIEVDGVELPSSIFRSARINLVSKNLRDSHAILLAVSVRVNPALTSIVLWGNHISDTGIRGLARALEHNLTVTELVVSWNRFGAVAMDGIAQMLSRNVALRKLVMYGNGVRDAGAKVFAGSLGLNRTLRDLILFSNEIGNAGAIDLAEGLLRNRGLRELGLGHNNIEDEGAKALFGAVKKNAQRGGATGKAARKRSVMSRITELAGGAANTESITKLSLGGNRITSDAMGALADMLRENPPLREINLASNLIDDRGAKLVAEALALPSAPQAAAAAGNDAGMAEEETAVPNLEVLDLGMNKISPAIREEIRTAWNERPAESLYLD